MPLFTASGLGLGLKNLVLFTSLMCTFYTLACLCLWNGTKLDVLFGILLVLRSCRLLCLHGFLFMFCAYIVNFTYGEINGDDDDDDYKGLACCSDE